jgi:hypothetical protein
MLGINLPFPRGDTNPGLISGILKADEEAEIGGAVSSKLGSSTLPVDLNYVGREERESQVFKSYRQWPMPCEATINK